MTNGSNSSSLLIVVSAPSGTGKTTLCDMLLSCRSDLVYSISCTTREPRGSELDGVDYFYLSDTDFERRVGAGDFLEHARVHDYRYGTLRTSVQESLDAGQSVLMDIDVQGASQIRTALGTMDQTSRLRSAFVDIFIAPPSMDELRSRLQSRDEDSAGAIELRMENAEGEMARAHEYRHTVINDDLRRAHAELMEILSYEEEARM